MGAPRAQPEARVAVWLLLVSVLGLAPRVPHLCSPDSGLRGWSAGWARCSCRTAPAGPRPRRLGAPCAGGAATCRGSSIASTPACASRSSSASSEVGPARQGAAFRASALQLVEGGAAGTSGPFARSACSPHVHVPGPASPRRLPGLPAGRGRPQVYCLERTDQRPQLLVSLKAALETRLLHPGAAGARPTRHSPSGPGSGSPGLGPVEGVGLEAVLCGPSGAGAVPCPFRTDPTL